MAAALQWGAGVMFKLTFFLCAGLYTAMYFGGVNHGQQRFGLMQQPAATAVTVRKALQFTPEVATTTPAPVVANLTQTAFVPQAPLMSATPAVATDASAPVDPAPGAMMPGAMMPGVLMPGVLMPGVLMVVNTKSANVRSGPGQDFDVVGRLARGEAVLVVVQGEGADGWSLIRIEGDGMEGYIASRLLTE